MALKDHTVVSSTLLPVLNTGLVHPPKSYPHAAAKQRRRSPGNGRVACGTFRPDPLSGYRIALQAKRVVAWMTVPLRQGAHPVQYWLIIPAAGIMERG